MKDKNGKPKKQLTDAELKEIMEKDPNAIEFLKQMLPGDDNFNA